MVKKIDAQVNEITTEIQRKLNEIYSSAFKTFLAKKAKEIVYKRVKSGYGVTSDTDTSPQKQRLAPLSPSYVSYRSGKVKFFKGKQGQTYPVKPERGAAFKSPVTGEFGSAKRSNLTLTGQMLDAIKYEITRYGFELLIANTQRKDGKLTNEEVAAYASEMRPFFALTEDEQRILVREIQTKIRQILRSR